MRPKPLILLLLLAILQWKSSESASSNTKSTKDIELYFDDEISKIEGSAFADIDTDTEDTDAKGEDDEDSVVIPSSGSGFIEKPKVEEPLVYISKPAKTKKPSYATKESPRRKPQPTKATARPGRKFPGEKTVVIGETDETFINTNRIAEIDFKPEVEKRPKKPRRKDSEEEEPEMVDDNNTSNNEIGLMGRKTDEIPTSFFSKPGILFAVIGGAVVGLLCAILLVMFIVYRMRKKDEGSYPLDEPRRSANSNSYMRTSGKEFYA